MADPRTPTRSALGGAAIPSRTPPIVGSPDGGSTATLAELYLAANEMLAADRRLRTRYRSSVDGLTIPQVVMLIGLQDAGEATVGELTSLTDVTAATMTAMLDELEADGIVERERSSTDRRVVLVSLTARGEELATARRESWELRWREAFGDVSEGDVAIAADGIRRIAGILNGLGGADAE